MGGMILYVMRTFFAFFHIGSVEWVTDQVCWSHSRDGVVKQGEGWLYLSGERMIILGMEIIAEMDRC